MPKTEVRGGQIKDASVSLVDDVTGQLAVGNGGTGAASLTSGAVLVGAGSSAISGIAPGTSGNVLASNGSAWTSSAVLTTHTGATSAHGVTGSVVGTTDTQTLTNKRISKRVPTLTAGTSYTPAGDTSDEVVLAAPTAAFTINAPSGTPTDGQILNMRIRMGTTGFTPTFVTTAYMSSGIATLPTAALPASKTTSYTFRYDSLPARWVLMAADIVGY